MMADQEKTRSSDTYSEKETQRRFEAALRGARVVGHKPQSEMKLGKRRASRAKSPDAPSRKSQVKKRG